VARLEQVAALLEIKPTRENVHWGWKASKERAEALEEERDASVLDISLTRDGSRIEHYEMAGYLTGIRNVQTICELEKAQLNDRRSVSARRGHDRNRSPQDLAHHLSRVLVCHLDRL
jgi:ferritin-like metal-binding protein YciE